ncbi:hypothetical protein ACVBEH_16070 [Roseateles sp. GG27B]
MADPTGGSNKVGKMVKAATNVAPWAGATVAAVDVGYFDSVTDEDHLNAVTAIHSPAAAETDDAGLLPCGRCAGTHEGRNRRHASVQLRDKCFTTQANQWETLTFDFADTSTHYIPNGATTYDKTKPTVAKLDLAQTFNKVSVFFDYFLGDGASAYARMPDTRTYYFDDLTLAK